MRKRLIERIRKRGKLGYTLTELLTVIGIIAVVCAIAIPSIFSIRNALRFAQANNYAKSIFLAAQQNLTEMRSDGGLEPVQSANGAQSIPSTVTSFPDEFRTEYVFTTTGTQAFDRVLPATSIDASLRDDQIIIEYNPLTGNVYAVFYYEKTDLNLVSDYLDPGKGLPRDEATRKGMKLGYYDGSGLNSSQIELEQTQAIVNFENGEEGIVQVIVPLPESFYGKHTEFGDALNITLSISGDQSMADGSTKEPMSISMVMAVDEGFTGKLSDDGQSLIFEYPIDSLANRSSFVNYASNTQASAPGAVSSGSSLTTVADESKFEFNVLPGENVTITANVEYVGTGSEMVQIAPGILSGVNPMFEYLQPDGGTGYVLAVSNGRNLQNLNAIAPSIAKKITSVVFTSDIYWNDTVTYYNKTYGNGSTYHNTTMVGGTAVYDEAPARALPYFVPIHSEALFGTASFEYGVASWVEKIPDGPIKNFLLQYFSANSRVPTLTDEFDTDVHAAISGSVGGDKNPALIFNLNIDTTKYPVDKAFYAGTATADKDRFTGLFSYVNTSIDKIHIVNPTIKGYYFTSGDTNNPATGALVGAAGYNTYISNCAVYLDKSDPTFSYSKMTNQTGYYKSNDQAWYGVSGEGSVGGLVGYAKSHRTTTGELRADKAVLAFYNSFAAVNVSGNLRDEVRRNHSYYGYANKDYGYSNGVGGFIGNSQLTNFYNCYASGNVIATNTNAAETFGTRNGGIFNSMLNLFGIKLEFQYGGRESAGAGGFVGTSHGTRYTNCFATGTVTATSSDSNMGASGFVGIMCIDETFAYGNQADSTVDYTQIAQRTVFTNCYSVGLVTIDGVMAESFSGANCRIAFNLEEFRVAQTADYYRLLGQHYYNTNSLPSYEDFYIFKDAYYLSKYYLDEEPNSNNCASPASYPTLQNLIGNHQNATWIDEQIQTIKNIKLYDILNLGIFTKTYEEAYFDRAGNVEAEYVKAYKKGFLNQWEAATASSTHGYDLSGTYPFSKIKDLPFYGDWPAIPLASGIAYYEAYEKDSSGNYTRYYHFDRESTSNLKNSDSISVLKDGYAILSSSNKTITITVNDVSVQHTSRNDRYIANNKEYHVYWLTDAQMTAAEEFAKQSGQFYVPVTVTQDGDTHTFYFNPNVAKSQVNSAENHTYIPVDSANASCISCGNAYAHELHMPINKEMYIRSARQFAQLSEMTNFITADYRYIQQLNIDASAYLWADQIDDINQYVQVSSIGTADNPFNSSYSAHYIDTDTLEEKQYKLSGFKPVEAGLFGFIGETGVVADLIVECGNVTVGTVDAQNVPKFENVAVLAGVSNGIIDNVDLSLKGNVALTASKSAGLLAGCSDGSIIDCDVTVDQNMTVSVTAPNAGGLIGTAVGTAETKSTLTNSKVTLGGAFNVSNALNVGGIVGEATYLRADGMSVSLTSMTATAGKSTDKDPVFYAGGLAGYATESSFTGVVNGPTGNPFEIIFNGQMNAPDFCAAGAIGGAMNTTLTAVDATTNGISGNIAAGYLGNGTNTDVSNSFVIVSNDMVGSIGAAGVAGTIGSQSVFSYVPVTLNGVTIKSIEGAAAGYALEIKGEADVFNSPVTLGEYNTEVTDGKVTARTNKKASTINAKLDAAGYACVINGTVGDTRVVGPAAITGSNAAGFAVTVNGAVNLAHVSPALTADAAGYMLNANANLTVNGSDSAAGFALTIGEKGTIDNGYTLCSITSTGTVTIEVENDETTESTKLTETSESTETTASASPTEKPTEKIAATYGFAGTNNGTINRCMANVDIAGGFGFVGFNNGLVTTSYGWHNNVSTDKIVTKVKGKCYSSYFADMNSEAVDLYTADGKYELATLDDLNSKALNGFTTGYSSYPYNAKIKPEKYPYLMLRDHYGNWYTPPQYAYGVAYYEFYEDGTKVAHLLDLSDVEVTVEDELLSGYVHGSGLDNEKGISQYGYAVFRKADTEPDTGVLSELSGAEIIGLDYNSGKATYKFYELDKSDTGLITIPATVFSGTTATVDTRFANAVNVDNSTYEVRTAYHLSNVGKEADATFNQTHSITADSFTEISDFRGSYNGGGFTISVANVNTWMIDVNGTVQDLDIAVTGSFSAPIFGTVNTASGDEKTPVYALSGITVTAGEQVTEVPGALLVGTVNAGSTVSGCSVTAGTVTTKAGSFGGLVTTNAGTLSGNTVTIESLTANGSAVVGGLTATNSGAIIGNSKVVNVNILYTNGSDAAIGGLVGENNGTIQNSTVTANVQINGADGKHMIFGGLVGTNSGTIAVTDSSNVTVTYVQPDTTAATDKATIGGLVGIMSDGTLTDVIKTDNSESSGSETTKAPVLAVTGSISLNKDQSGANRGYVVGGAIGKITDGTASNLSTSVTVDAAWAKAANVEGNATFGTSGISGITNNGPVGMYVGYAGAATLQNCSSTAANETFQFLGEANIGSQSVDSSYWSSDTKSTTPLTAYSDDVRNSDGTLTASNETISANLKEGVTSCAKVNTVLANCMFIFDEENKVQAYGANTHFYSMTPTSQNGFKVGSSVVMSFNDRTDLSYKLEYDTDSSFAMDTDVYYKIDDNSFGRVFVSAARYRSGTSFIGSARYKYTITWGYYTDANEKHTVNSFESEQLTLTNKSTTVTIGDGKLCTLSIPSISSDNYLVTTGNIAVGENGSSEAFTVGQVFDQRKTLSNYLYSFTGSELTKGQVIHRVVSDTTNEMYYSSNKPTVIFSFEGLTLGNETLFTLNPVEVTEDTYQLLTFTWQNNTLYQNQFITCN